MSKRCCGPIAHFEEDHGNRCQEAQGMRYSPQYTVLQYSTVQGKKV